MCQCDMYVYVELYKSGLIVFYKPIWGPWKPKKGATAMISIYTCMCLWEVCLTHNVDLQWFWARSQQPLPPAATGVSRPQTDGWWWLTHVCWTGTCRQTAKQMIDLNKQTQVNCLHINAKYKYAMVPEWGRSSAKAVRVLGGRGRERHRCRDTLNGGSNGDTPGGRDKA